MEISQAVWLNTRYKGKVQYALPWFTPAVCTVGAESCDFNQGKD